MVNRITNSGLCSVTVRMAESQLVCQSQRKNEIQYVSFAFAVTEKSSPPLHDIDKIIAITKNDSRTIRSRVRDARALHTHVIETEITVN